MDKLEALITEALEKFPSEDIRELVAKETGLTVEEVSQKMNEAAKAAGNDFPAANFAVFETKKGGLNASDMSQYTGDLDGDGESNTESDKEIAAERVTEAIDSNNDGMITFKIGYLPESSSSNGLGDYSSTNLSDITFEEKTVKIGTTLEEALDGYDYEKVYTSWSSETNGVYEYSTKSIDLSNVETVGDINGLSSPYWPGNTFVADGSIILLEA